MKNKKVDFSKDFIVLSKNQKKKPFTLKPKLNKPFAIRKKAPIQSLLDKVEKLHDKLDNHEKEKRQS